MATTQHLCIKAQNKQNGKRHAVGTWRVWTYLCTASLKAATETFSLHTSSDHTFSWFSFVMFSRFQFPFHQGIKKSLTSKDEWETDSNTNYLLKKKGKTNIFSVFWIMMSNFPVRHSITIKLERLEHSNFSFEKVHTFDMNLFLTTSSNMIHEPYAKFYTRQTWFSWIPYY